MKLLSLLIIVLLLTSCSQNYSQCRVSTELYAGLEDLLTQGKTEEVIRRFSPSATEGNPASQNVLAAMLWHNSPEEAFKWNMLSAKQGCIEGATAVASSYRNGHGVKKDPALAFDWFLKSAKSGDKASAYIVSTMYDKGEGVTQDEAKSSYWFNEYNKK